jgi:nicotinamide mononucleotide adenylyltransferase
MACRLHNLEQLLNARAMTCRFGFRRLERAVGDHESNHIQIHRSPSNASMKGDHRAKADEDSVGLIARIHAAMIEPSFFSQSQQQTTTNRTLVSLTER